MTASRWIVSLAEAQDASRVGGKAINLCRLIRAGLPVPEGFVVTTEAFRQAADSGTMPEEMVREVRQAYGSLGGPKVAVRSSATAEDLAGASMAGQYETFLDVTGPDEVVAAVERCWRSLQAERIQTYLHKQRIDPKDVAVAVVVQQLVPAEASGVLFTADPGSGASDEMVIEAVYGLGEGLVSGQVQPDVYRMHAETGQVLELHVAEKTRALHPGNDQYQDVPAGRVRKACLRYEHLQSLRQFGRRAQEHFGGPQDIEWALADGRIHILQARAITTLAETQAYHALLKAIRQVLTGEVSRGHGPWVRHNLSETLPLPSPLTWSLIRSFMSGAGGFGRMHQRVGFAPSEAMKENGFLTLIAGQIYMDCSRLPEMFCAGYPYRYDLAQLRYSPDAAQQPPTLPQGTYRELAAAARLGTSVTGELRRLAETLDVEFDEQLVPRVNAWCQAQAELDLTALSDDELIALWQSQREMVLNDFGATVFLPSMVEALAAADLKGFLAEHVWDEDPEVLTQQLSASPRPDVTVRSNIELQEVAQGRRPRQDWLRDHGFRGPGEFDLAGPRWSERPDELEELAKPLAEAPNVAQRHHDSVSRADQCLTRLRGRLDRRLAAKLQMHVDLLQRYVRFREDGKAVLIRAFTQLRHTSLEFGRRLGIGKAVFFLHEDEMCMALEQGFVPQGRIAERRLRRKAAKKITLSHVIEADDIPTLGEPQISDAGDSYDAFPVATGSCTGPTRIVLDPTQAHDLGDGYILVCPSTDPAWTPLFARAAGLILERGGTLSHGAIVAREMGLPAVVLENATMLFCDDETLTIDGNRGRVVRNAGSTTADGSWPDPEDTHIPYPELPPVPGQKERQANRCGLLAALSWGAVLALAYLLPASWLKEPVFDAIDAGLWPLVRNVGMVWTVALVGVFFGVVPLLIQRYTNDNARLREAKRRSADLQKAAKRLPAGSTRRKTMLDLASPITMRTLKASMASLAWLLGPMILVFLWMPTRLDPASWNADPGGLVTVAVELDGEYQGPVTCKVPPPLILEDTTPVTQTLPPIRATLEDLRREWQQGPDLAEYPWQLQTAGEQAQEILLTSLNRYLTAAVPPQRLTWMVRVPEEANGHYPVRLEFSDRPSREITLAFGHSKPPVSETVSGMGDPLIRIEAVYPRPLQRRHFWVPLQAVGGPAWDFGWLGVYVLSYLLAMVIAKRLLRIP